MTYPTVFDLHDQQRLLAWRRFRDSLETSATPLETTAEFWAAAPFVEQYLDDSDPTSWPGAWELILGGKFDNLGIALGIFYTLALTNRFMNSPMGIYRATRHDNQTVHYVVIIERHWVLNWSYRTLIRRSEVESQAQLQLIY